MWHLTACKISVSLSVLNWVMIFYLTLTTLIQRHDKKSFHFKTEKLYNWNFTGCQVPYFMTVLTLYINLLNLSWIIKCLFFEEQGAFLRLIRAGAVRMSVSPHFFVTCVKRYFQVSSCKRTLLYVCSDSGLLTFVLFRSHSSWEALLHWELSKKTTRKISRGKYIQSNLDSSNTDGSFTMANSKSFLSP